ncbi:hypothetical protein H9L39_01917 [Fusarium oxysporum f. sp. albedinis]|nr:hypothetical protein H9L39_01917 [Fusarium oxysporum f. sp. albedinis]
MNTSNNRLQLTSSSQIHDASHLDRLGRNFAPGPSSLVHVSVMDASLPSKRRFLITLIHQSHQPPTKIVTRTIKVLMWTPLQVDLKMRDA